VPSIGAHVDEARVLERAEVKRYGAERDVRHRRVNLSRRLFARPHHPQDLATPG
jgi:hypothetical protein